MREIKRTTAVPNVIKLAVVLRLFASGSYQELVGRDSHLNVSKSKVSKILSEMIPVMLKLAAEWIQFGTRTEEVKAHFSRNYKLPGVEGCVDGTHINLLRPKKDEEIYVGRKLVHTMNAMIVSCSLNQNEIQF